MVATSSQNFARDRAQNHFPKHTVYTLPRSVQWHVEQRMPDAIQAALRDKITAVIDAFAKAGLDFRNLVTVNYQNATSPDITLDFGEARYEQMSDLGRLLSELFDDIRAADMFDTKALGRNAAERAILSMLRDNLRLNKQEFDVLRDELTVDVKRDVPASALRHTDAKRDRSEWADLLERGDGPLPLLGPQGTHSVDELVATVFARAPWMDQPLTKIWSLMKAYHGEGLRLPPILLHGPGGTGKSMLARLIAEVSSTPSLEMDGSAGSAGSGSRVLRAAGVPRALASPLGLSPNSNVQIQSSLSMRSTRPLGAPLHQAELRQAWSTLCYHYWTRTPLRSSIALQASWSATCPGSIGS
ncbi:MAG: AAA family ATPase [Cognatishimia sp.]